MVVCDATNFRGLETVEKWKNDIDRKVSFGDGRPVPVLLIANKSDLTEYAQLSDMQLTDICQELGFMGWFRTSAKTATGIEEAVDFLCDLLLDKYLTSVMASVNNKSIKLEDHKKEYRCGC